MRIELQTVLDSLPSMQREQLPELLGELEVVRATAVMRLSAPATVTRPVDELLSVEEASQRLGMSANYLYRHSDTLPFVRRVGRALRFSSVGIDDFIARKRK